MTRLGLALGVLLGLSAFSAGTAGAFPFTSPGAGTSQKTFLTGETTTAHILTTAGGTLKCTTVSSSGSVTGPEQSAVTLTPSYSGCSAYGFGTTHVKTNGCTYRLEVPTTEPAVGEYTAPPFRIICPAGKEIEITPTAVGVSACTQRIPEQTPTKGHVLYTNNAQLGAGMDYSAESTVEGVHYTGTGGACGNSETHSDGVLSGRTTIKGYEDEAHSKSFGVTVA